MTPSDPRVDVLFSGTGYFTEVMVADLAATARSDILVAIGGRNPARVKWLVEACRARAEIYGTAVRFTGVMLDSRSSETLAEALRLHAPKVIIQSASAQSPWKVDNGESAWANLVAEAGFGMTIAFHALLAWRTANAIARAGLDAHFVNSCYPDGVNQVIAAAGLPMTTGVGNIGIFSSVLAARLPFEVRSDVRVLAHHRHIVEWRKPPAERAGPPVRAWVGEHEMRDVDARTDDIQLPYRDLNLISGASAVPVILALAGEGRRRCHVPGPAGLPGGYPVLVDQTGVALDLPSGVSRDDAINWNRQFEEKDGVSIRDGRVVYSARARELIGLQDKSLAQGFDVDAVEAAAAAMDGLRTRLGG
jgi:hypothetical protein